MGWVFTRLGRFIDGGCFGLKGQAESGKQFLPVARSRTQDKWTKRGGVGGVFGHVRIVSAFFYTAGMTASSPPPKSIWNPARLDVPAFAKAGQVLGGAVEIGALERLKAELMPEEGAPLAIDWQMSGEFRPDSRGEAVPWLHLEAKTLVPLPCQRCLGPVATELEVDRWFRFVADEATAELEDEDCEEDVLALEPRPDVLALLEDELLMSMPLVPMHQECPTAVPMQAGALAADEEAMPQRENPFAQLARLKR